MRPIIVVIATLALIFAASIACADPLDAAMAKAQQTNTDLIVQMGAEWCQPCKDCRRQYEADLCKRGQYIHIDIDREKHVMRRLPGPPIYVQRIPAIAVYRYDPRLRCWTPPKLYIGAPGFRLYLSR